MSEDLNQFLAEKFSENGWDSRQSRAKAKSARLARKGEWHT
jgi:hypothetical protein